MLEPSRRLAVPIFLLALAGSVTARAAAAAPEFSGAATVDGLIGTAIAEGKLPGAVLLVGHQGVVVYQKAYGHRALFPQPEAMTLDTIFDCASLTKVVATTSAVMKLYETGKIRLSDKVTDFLPEFQNGKSDLTIRDLMTHYSGFRPDFDLEPAWSGYDAGIQRALAEVPTAPRGTKFIYSDTNFILLGEIVRRISGQTLDAFTRDQIFRPLGMNETEFKPEAALMGRIAPTERQPSGEILRGVVHDPRSRLMGGVAGHAGMFSTAADLSRFCQMLLNKGVNPAADATHPKRIFLASTVDLFTSPQSPTGAAAVRGLGWDINSPFSGNRGELFPAGTSFGHTGFTGTSLWMDPASQTYVILLANSVHPVVGKAITPLRKSVATAVAAAFGYSKGAAAVGSDTGSGGTRTGLDVLAAGHFASLQGKRVGLLTNATGIDRTGRRNIDVMREAGVKITAIFSPEHGFLAAEDKENIAGSVDQATGIRVFSLYSQKTMRPTREMLSGIDVMVFDIADVGARFYTYITTMGYAMEECARTGKPFVVLDRPNPVTGLHVEGPMLDAANESMVGYYPMPVRHGMTVGEVARLFNEENKIHADLTVVQMTGWHRDDWFDATGLPWVNPSPNIRNLNAALVYTGVAMLEFSENYSVGRGTAEPFEVIGAKWIKGTDLAAYLNLREIPGIRVYPVLFRPDSSHYSGTNIEGVRLIVTNRDVLDTERLGLEIAAALNHLYPGQIDFRTDRRLIGSNAAVEQLAGGKSAEEVKLAGRPSLEQFLEVRSRYLLYPAR